MSSPEEILQLQLGDIIQIESPTNDKFNDNIFLITYIDNQQIEVQDIDSLAKTTLLLSEDGGLEDETIDSISLLSRDKEEGYARQHGLVPKTWVTLTFGGDLPAIFTGEITNLEEDMIEIKTYPEKQVIYIDFAYKGLPKTLPIKSIDIRDPPDLEILEGEEVTMPPEKEETEGAVPVPAVKQQIQQFIIQADDITFGEDLGAITQEVQIGKSYERFGIQTQTNDLLDELLATIPNQERTTRVLNTIHKMIERYKELRMLFSTKDEYGNPLNPITKGANYKPLVDTLRNLNRRLAWILPVVKNKKKIYDVDEADAEVVDDIVNMTMAESQIQETDAYEKYTNNEIPDSENKYGYLLKETHDFGIPYENPDGDAEDFITRQRVEADIAVLVDNLDDFYSSVVAKDNLSRKRYLMTKYNIGLSKLETVVEAGSKPYNKKVMATPNNKVYIKSLVLLPEHAVRHSRVELPGSSILLKTILNKERFNYYQRFTKETSVNTQVIESFETPIQHTFLQSATEILLDDSLQSEEDKYDRYLNSVVPKTRTLFEMVKKYIDEKLTLSEVVKELEPFMVYNDDLTYRQYREIVAFIKIKIADYKKGIVAKSRDFRSLVSGKKFADKTWYSLFNILQKERKEVLEVFYGLQMRNYTSSENYSRIMSLDSGRLFLTALAIENLMLMTPVDIKEMFERDHVDIKNAEMTQEAKDKEAKCQKFTLVKRYLELDELLEDNGKTVFVDKNLDQTRYDIVEEYLSEREAMSPEEFTEFLKERLVDNIGLSEEQARKDAAAMVMGKRPVEDGEYCSLEIDGGEKTYYYKRNGSQWERDESIPDVKMDEKMFCNLQPDCADTSDSCNDLTNTELQTEGHSLEKLIKEFDIRYEVSSEELARLLQNRFLYLKNRITIRKKLNVEETYKYNDAHLRIALKVKEEEPVPVSPYAQLRDAILGQPDFVKRNNDIVRFYTMFLREANDDTEDKFWFYCRETNLKLFPVFIYTLASAFIQDQYSYVRVLDRLCATQGKLSDDGNAWVDEHSGYIIKTVEFNTEEGYDDGGFKTQTRDLLQDDLRTLRGAELERKFSDPNAEKISNVVQSMAGYMGFSVEPMQEFIIRNTLIITARILPSEDEYDKKRDALAKKGKKIPEYKDAYNTSMLLVVFCYFLVGIQTAVPSIRTKKQFPGCKKSFEGFPLDGSGDDSGLTYVACVANKIKSGVAPWNVLKKMNSTGIAKRMKDLINKYIVPDASIQTIFNEKRVYLQQADDDMVPGELDIVSWQTFLPPLRPIATIPREEISAEFKEELIRNIRAGKSAQEGQLNAIVANMIHYPMVMIEEIQKIVSKEVPLLTNVASEAFLENSCCIDSEERTTINYFMNRVPALRKYNDFVKQLHTIYSDIKDIALAPRIFSPTNTRRVYPALSNNFSKKTIYRAFIHYCKFGTLFPVPENIQAVCMTKTQDFSLFDSLSTQIKTLEEDGKNFTLEDLQRLLYIVDRENIISVSLYDDEKSSLERMRDYLDEGVMVIPERLHDTLKAVVDTFDLNVDEPTREMKSLINYLDREINDMKTSLIVFLQQNSKLSKRNFNQIMEVLQTTAWKAAHGEEDAVNIRGIDAMKNWIYELTQVFPNMVANEVDYDGVTFPGHWRKGLSERHINDLRGIVQNYYKTFTQFYGNEVLTPLMKQITGRTQLWRDFVNVLPIFERIERDGNIPTLNTGIVEQLVTYSLLKCYMTYVEVISETTQLGMPVAGGGGTVTEEFVATTAEEVVNEEIGNISEIDIIAGEKLQRSELMAAYLIEITNVFNSTKKLLNYSYEDVIYRVNVSKEKEKDQFTKRLKDLSDEEREIENLMKNHKLGEWSKGLSKGVTQYEKDTYDEERKAMERIIELERQVGKQDFVSDMNRAIYVDEAAEQAQRAAQIEAEELRIEYMGEDAEYEDMGMDGDEIFY